MSAHTNGVPADWREVMANLAQIVYTQNGNQHDEITDLLDQTKAVLAAPVAQAVPVAGEREAFEVWYAKRHPYPVQENATWAHACKMDDWEVWQARAALAQPVVQEQWQPIETAPKDGSSILLYLPAPWDRVELAYWFAHWENWQSQGDKPDTVRDEYCGIGSELPTHWMPIPSAPRCAK